MSRLINKETIFIFLFFLISIAGIGYACSAGPSPRFINVLALGQKINLSELTPVESKRLERVMNNEASPCGDDVTLAESVFNIEHCPLAVYAINFIIEQIKEDYTEEEISQSYLMRYGSVKGLEIPIDGSPTKGPEKAMITFVVFTDFRCPFCAKTAETLDELQRTNPDKYKLVYKNFPLTSIHPDAEIAARGAFAAHMQNKFWEMHDVIFSTVGTELTREQIDIIAEGIGLDKNKFSEDFASAAATAAIENDKKLGESLGVKGTPQIFVNGRTVDNGMKNLTLRIKEESLRASVSKP